MDFSSKAIVQLQCWDTGLINWFASIKADVLHVFKYPYVLYQSILLCWKAQTEYFGELNET